MHTLNFFDLKRPREDKALATVESDNFIYRQVHPGENINHLDVINGCTHLYLV